MATGSNIASTFLADVFGASTSEPVFLSSLPNADARDRQPSERRLATRDPSLVERFLADMDRKDRGAYFCVSTITAAAKQRSKAALAELNCLFADIDFKSVSDAPAEIERKLGQLMLLPSKVVHSGHGLHCYWIFKEAVPATAESIDRLEALLRLLADHVGGDLSVCEASRLMRLPGSHNTKNGEWIEVRVIADRPLRYDLNELAEWVEIVSPIIHRKPSGVHGGNGADTNNNPWLAVAARFGAKPPIDVEARLAAMCYQGAGEAGIHATQISVSAALLNRGSPLDEVVDVVLAATRAAAGPFGERWNWCREERAIRSMAERWLAKHPQSDRTETRERQRAEAESQTSEDEGETKPRKRESRGAARDEIIAAIVAGVIEAVQREGRELLLTGGELHLYNGGVWRAANSADEQHLKVLIQIGVRTLKQSIKVSTLNAAWKLLCEHPDLYVANIAWDEAAVNWIAVSNGMLDLSARILSPWRSDYYLRRKLTVAFEPSAEAPNFSGFLASLFADRDETTRTHSTGLLQEFFGAALAIGQLNREQRRALLLVGPSRVGKTELGRVLRLLIGGSIAAPAVRETSERFGLASFVDAAAWIRDDAINEGDRVDPERFKTIVTGEPIDIERKNRTALASVRLCIPVLLTANILPTARDSSDAIFNRCLVIELTNVINEVSAVAARRRLGVPTGKGLADFLIEQEGAGILNWSLAGLTRLLERGQFEIPDHVADSIQRFKDDSNAVAAWARTMVEREDRTMVERADMLCTFQGWWREEMGDDVRLLGGRWLVPKLKAACPWISEVTKHGGIRYLAGVALTDAGLRCWEQQSQDAVRSNRGAKGSASGREFVNRMRNDETLF